MIHYHGVPFSGDKINLQSLSRRHAMVSFSAPHDMAQVAEITQSFTLDNGAFSAWKKGKVLDIDGFMKWASVWVNHPGCDFAIIPDEIEGSEKDNDALLSLAPNKHNWCPVWHLHESIERAERLANEWPRLALGSSGDFSDIGTQKWWDKISEALNAITRNGVPFTKLHGLRMLDPRIFSLIPFSSADSTNVGRNIGLDARWSGPYVPSSQYARALVIMDRIENHASASRWIPDLNINNSNMDLFG